MKYNITGSNLQIANIELDAGEELVTTGGAMVYTTGNVAMETKMEGGFMSGLKRSVSGAGMFLVKFKPQGGTGIVGIGGSAPGKIIELDISKKVWICQRSSFLASEKDVKIDIAFQKKLGSALFGGEGFVLQKLSGNGLAFIEIDGTAIEYDLAPGQQMVIDTGYLAMMDATCTMRDCS